MTRIAAVVLAALIAGCGSLVLTPEQAQRMSILEVCTSIVTDGPKSAAVAEAEAQRRGLDCKQYQGAVNASIGAPAATSTYTPPRTCRSVQVGNSVQTQCN